jgi:hypothetical protein
MTEDYQYDWRKSSPRLPHLHAGSILAICDGLTREPPRYTFDCRGLTDAEYLRVVAWTARRRGWPVYQLAEEPAP